MTTPRKIYVMENEKHRISCHVYIAFGSTALLTRHKSTIARQTQKGSYHELYQGRPVRDGWVVAEPSASGSSLFFTVEESTGIE